MEPLTFRLGKSQIEAPDSWTMLSHADDKVVLTSNQQQQATISLMRFEVELNFEQFKTLCAAQIRAVQKAVPSAFVEPESPFQDRGAFGMFYFGGDKTTGQIFFGYLSLAQRELVTMFVEGFGVDPQAQGSDFSRFVKSLKRD